MSLLFRNFKHLWQQQYHLGSRGKALKMRLNFLKDFKNRFLKNR